MAVQDNRPKVRKTICSLFIKLVLDIVLSGTAIIILSPLLIVIIMLELIFHERPIVYAQK